LEELPFFNAEEGRGRITALLLIAYLLLTLAREVCPHMWYVVVVCAACFTSRENRFIGTSVLRGGRRFGGGRSVLRSRTVFRTPLLVTYGTPFLEEFYTSTTVLYLENPLFIQNTVKTAVLSLSRPRLGRITPKVLRVRRTWYSIAR
jgi:hypothetical protein